MTKKTTNSKPIHTIRIGNIEAAIWKNTSKENESFYPVTVSRSYKDGDSWKSSTSFSGETQLLAASKIYELAGDWIRDNT